MVELSGERFNITISESFKVLRAYLKKAEGKNFIRLERIEGPKKNLAEIISRRLDE